MKSHIIAFDKLWQTPAKTELHAFNQLQKIDELGDEYCYIAFPWATLIDFLQTSKPIPGDLISAFERIKIESRRAAKTKKLVTVCQHIYASRYISIFKACRVSVLYWSHCTVLEPEISGITIQPFPLYAVHEPSRNEVPIYKQIKSRPIRASFIGAYDSRYYLTDIRKEIFSISEASPKDFLIITRDNWHFQEEVYTRQIRGKELEDTIREKKEKEQSEYRDTLRDTLFSLCPSGSGPNSIRIWETLAFNSIPVIFADTLSLPGEVQEWIKASIFLPENTKRCEIINVLNSHASKSSGELEAKVEAAARIYSRYGNSFFIWDIVNRRDGKMFAIDIPQRSRKNRSASDGDEIEAGINADIQLDKTHSTLVIDPGLKDTGSHHDRINRGLLCTLNPLLVLSHIASASKTKEFAYKTRPSFTSSIYDENTSLTSGQYTGLFKGFATSIAYELRRSTAIQSIYLHTATASLIQGLALAIQLSKREARGLRAVYLQLMFSPYSLLSPLTKASSLRSDARYKTAIASLVETCSANKIQLSIETSNSVFQDLYNNLLCSEIVGIHPHVFAKSQSTDFTSQLGANDEILLHSGDPRPGKGLEWLGDSLETIIKSTASNKKLVIHYGELRYPLAFPEIQVALRSIESVAERHPDRLRLLTGKLEDKEWQNLLNCSRAYILHNPECYRFRTSGNFYDILMGSIGRTPIYLTCNTLSLDIARREGLSHGEVIYGDTIRLVKSINEDTVNPPCAGEGFHNFKTVYIDKDHASHVLKRLTTSNIENSPT
jgi:hypothetical protein